jgi:hypothetical protein
MNKIPNLYNGINFNTLPKVIYDELITNSNDRGFTVTKNDKGETITIDGEYLRPFFMSFSEDYNFYLNLKHYEYLEHRLKNGNCFDKDYNKLDVQNIYPFYKYYNDGFLKGYNEFENSLKNHTALFNITNEQIAFKIYSRVTQSGYIKENDGGFLLVSDSRDKEIDEKICKEYGIKFVIKIYEENFFKSGFEGGEFYKAWEIILNNPTVFEPIFLKNIKNEIELIEPEAIDLSDTIAIDKILYLQKLGVIDFLRGQQPFTSVPDKVAQILSAITGIKIDSIRPMLRPIINNDLDDNKNPLNSKKAVSRVEKQLINIGFNLNETN